MGNDLKANPVAYAAVLAVLRSAWALVDNTGYHEWLPLAINRDDWNDLAARMAALKALIPEDELPAEPPHAVVCFWPTASGSRPERNEVAEMQIRYLCGAFAGTIDEKAALVLRVRELETENARLRAALGPFASGEQWSRRLSWLINGAPDREQGEAEAKDIVRVQTAVDAVLAAAGDAGSARDGSP